MSDVHDRKLGDIPQWKCRICWWRMCAGFSAMALRLSKALGRSPESWLAMQDNYDLWHARQTLDLEQIQKVEFVA